MKQLKTLKIQTRIYVNALFWVPGIDKASGDEYRHLRLHDILTSTTNLEIAALLGPKHEAYGDPVVCCPLLLLLLLCCGFVGFPPPPEEGRRWVRSSKESWGCCGRLVRVLALS